MSVKEEVSVQKNIASELRAAARDYLEIHAPTSIEFALDTWPAKRLDSTAIENPRFFEARYGFQAPKAVRIKLIEFQREHDLLDNEARLLKKTGFLQVNRQHIQIDTSVVVPILGWIQLLLLTGMIALMLPVVVLSKSTELAQFLGLAILGFIFMVSAAWTTRTCIRPRKILKECGALHQIDMAASSLKLTT